MIAILALIRDTTATSKRCVEMHVPLSSDAWTYVPISRIEDLSEAVYGAGLERPIETRARHRERQWLNALLL